MKKNVYQIVTDRIIDLMASGVNPWRKEWQTFETLAPRNFGSGRLYTGLNSILLDNGVNPYYLTYKQILEKGGKVKKGAKSRIALMWIWTYKDKNGKATKNESEAFKKDCRLRYYRVFNGTDIEGIEFPQIELDIKSDLVRIADCEEFVKGTKAVIEEGGNRAYYDTGRDYIRMPLFEAFNSVDGYYSTLFHELGHWTGAKHRLNREFSNSKKSKIYAKEELIAELTSAFVCARLGVDNSLTQEQNASYLKGWIKALKNDAKMLVIASARAEKACKYLLSLQGENALEVA